MGVQFGQVDAGEHVGVLADRRVCVHLIFEGLLQTREAQC